MDELSRWLEDQPEASFVTSYTDLLKTLNKAEHDNDESWNKLPEDNLQIIDYLVGYQLVQEIEPHLEPIFNPDYSAIRLLVGTSNLTNVELLAFNDRVEEWISNNLNPGYKVMHGDNSILFARVDRAISLELLEGFVVSAILITLTILIGLKSVRYGLLSIMPNLFPASIVFGFWGLFVGELSPYILMLFSISIGLVVDDSVHVLSKYISARRDGQSPERAIQYSLAKAGSAITITTASLAIGTLILVFSNTFYFQNVAQLLTPIIVVALLLDLLFLPPLLIKFDNWLEGKLPPAESWFVTGCQTRRQRSRRMLEPRAALRRGILSGPESSAPLSDRRAWRRVSLYSTEHRFRRSCAAHRVIGHKGPPAFPVRAAGIVGLSPDGWHR